MKRRDDIPVTDSMPRAAANAAMIEQAANLVSMGQQEQFGVFVAKHGQGYAVFLRNRGNNDSFDVSPGA